MSGPPKPPKPVPRPGKVRVYRALFAYAAERTDELSFQEGDVLYVTEGGAAAAGAAGDWLRASSGGRQGLIPANYVEESLESLPHPLHEAARRGNMEQLEECLGAGVSANSLDASGSTPLYWAAHGGHSAALRRLLRCPGLCLDGQNKLGDTALHAAAWKGREGALRDLLQAGASTALRNAQGQTPKDIASSPATQALLGLLAQPAPAQDADCHSGDDSD